MANQRNGQLNQRQSSRQVGEDKGYFVSLSPKINVLNDINSGSLSIQLGRSERYNYRPMWLHCLRNTLKGSQADNEGVRKCLCEPGVAFDNSANMLVRFTSR